MMVLISYDVSTMDGAGKTRLRKVAKECQNHAAAASRRDLSSASAALVFAAWLYVHPKLRLPVMAEQLDRKDQFCG